MLSVKEPTRIGMEQRLLDDTANRAFVDFLNDENKMIRFQLTKKQTKIRHLTKNMICN